MSIQSAIKNFSENFALFNRRPVTDHEKYNLYAGLSEMAVAIKSIEYDLTVIRKTVEQIARKVG
jgi:hypothetical protein